MVHVHRPLSTRISANLRLARTLDTAVRGLNSLGDGFFRPSSRCRPLLSSPFLCSMPNAASVQHSSMSCAKSLEVAALLTLPALRCAFAGHGVRRVFDCRVQRVSLARPGGVSETKSRWKKCRGRGHPLHWHVSCEPGFGALMGGYVLFVRVNSI